MTSITLVRLYSYGFWLLSVSLALGWAGSAAADITLSVDTPKIREEGGKRTITVTAANVNSSGAKTEAAANTAVALVLGTTPAPIPGLGLFDPVNGRLIPRIPPSYLVTARKWFEYSRDNRPRGDWKDWYDSRAHVNDRFAITLPTIVIPKGKKEATGTIILTPRDNDIRGFYNTYDEFTIPFDLDDDYPKRYPDLVIKIKGLAGGTNVDSTDIQVIDDEKLSSRLDLSFSPASLSKDAGPTPVTVTAALNGGTLSSDQTFTLVFANATSLNANDYPSGITSSDVLARDTDYSATSASLTLRRGRSAAKATITIDPKGKAGRIVIKSASRKILKGIDLNLDGDKTDTLPLYREYNLPGNPIPIAFREAGLGCKYLPYRVSDPVQQHDVNFDGRCFGLIREARVGIDLNGDGEISQPANNGDIPTSPNTDPNLLYRPAAADFYLWPTQNAMLAANREFVVDRGQHYQPTNSRFALLESKLPQYVTIPPHFFEITTTPIVDLKNENDGLTATPATVREGAGRQEIILRVTLKSALTEDTRVSFTINPQEGRRDIDYTIALSDLVIPKGQTSASTTLVLTPVDNSAVNDARTFDVVATVGSGATEASETITIVDDETLTSQITLTASPNELNAGTGASEVTVRGTLDGQAFDEDVNVVLVVTTDTDDDGDMDDDDKAATRDTEYTAILRSLTIPAGEIIGSQTISITPLAGGDKKIGLTALKSPVKNDDDEDVTVTTTVVTLKDGDETTTVPGALAFEDDIDVVSTVFEYAVGRAIEPYVLPAATGGIGDKTYSVSATLPAGLAFDADTRTLSGTPLTTGTATVIYTVIDSAPDEVNTAVLSLTFEIGTAPPATVRVASVTSTHSSVRENGETTSILLMATLAAPSAKPETVLFTIAAPSAGTPAVRDADYTAVLGSSVVIAPGETQGRTTLTLTPIDNAEVDGNRYLGVEASASGGSARTDIKIADDETPSTSLSLSVSPHTLSEDAVVTQLTVTATLDGKVLDADATVAIAIDPASSATRDLDYSALFNPSLVIPAGSTSGSLTLLIDPTADREDEGNETITLNGSSAGLTGGSVDITIKQVDASTVTPPPEATPLAFADGTSVDDQEYTAGTAISDIELPAASGGAGDIAYSVSGLPAGLSFDAATRTISGTPDAATDEAVEITYTAADGAGATTSLTFSITVNMSLTFGDFFSQFLGAGKVVPTASSDGAAIREFVVGQPVDAFALPAGTGGTVPLTYTLSPELPAGLSFDAATRTISGTPQAEGAPVYTYTVTDALGASVAMLLHTRPAAFSLASNYPNPFNPATTIRYALPQAADVRLTVYNVVGQAVRTLVAEHQSAGRYLVAWDATNDNGHSLSAGIYFYRLQAGDEFHAVKKMLLLK